MHIIIYHLSTRFLLLFIFNLVAVKVSNPSIKCKSKLKKLVLLRKEGCIPISKFKMCNNRNLKHFQKSKQL